MSIPEKRAIADIEIGARHRKELGDLQNLADSIGQEGLLQPIGITADNLLVFGERRLVACRDLLGWTEIDVRIVNVTSIAAGEYAENEMRKDFTMSERVAIMKTIERKPHGGDRKSNQAPDLALDFLTREQAAKLAGFGGHETARRATFITERGAPELVDAVDKKEISIDAAYVIATRVPEQEQKAIVDLPKPERGAAVRKHRAETPTTAPKPGKPIQSTEHQSKTKPTQELLSPLAPPVIRPDNNLSLCRFLLREITDPDKRAELGGLITATFNEALQRAFTAALTEMNIPDPRKHLGYAATKH